jgi:TolB protein
VATASLVQAQTTTQSLNGGPSRQQAQQQPAQTGGPIEVEIDQGVMRPFQIAVAPFSGQNGASIADVVSGDLRRSGFFEPINPASFIETGLTLANAPNFPQWTQIGAQAVLYGSVTMWASGCTTPTVSASWSATTSPQRPSSGGASATRSPTSSMSG